MADIRNGKYMDMAFLNPENWETPTTKESKDFYNERSKSHRGGAVLVFQKHLNAFDVYTYLKARFGDPNGFMNIIRSNSTDNIMHWDYLLKYQDIFINIIGLHRDVQIIITCPVTNAGWQELVENFRRAFSKSASEKQLIKHDLEEWVVFINRYAQLCEEAAIHYDTIEKLEEFQFNMPELSSECKKIDDPCSKEMKAQTENFQKLEQACLTLKLLTPILLEAFINLLILVLGKKEVKDNKIIYDARVRQDLHIKIPELHLTCDHFSQNIDISSVEYKNFTKIMNNRNWFFHGNADPQKDKMEVVHFDKSNIPLFKTSGNMHEKYFNTLIGMIKPKKILHEYVQAHEFIISVVNCIEPKQQDHVWGLIDSTTIGYNEKENRFGLLFSNTIVSSQIADMPTDQHLFDSNSS